MNRVEYSGLCHCTRTKPPPTHMTRGTHQPQTGRECTTDRPLSKRYIDRLGTSCPLASRCASKMPCTGPSLGKIELRCPGWMACCAPPPAAALNDCCTAFEQVICTVEATNFALSRSSPWLSWLERAGAVCWHHSAQCAPTWKEDVILPLGLRCVAINIRICVPRDLCPKTLYISCFHSMRLWAGTMVHTCPRKARPCTRSGDTSYMR